jgi:DNA polymerase-3 subunit beta
MNITILQENLHKGLGRVIRIVALKPQLPILTHVLLSAKNGQITLKTTNLETSIQTLLPGKIEEEGEICVPARLLFELVALLPKETIKLSLKEESLIVKTQKSKATIPGISAGEFPRLSEFIVPDGVGISNDTLRLALGQVLFAAGTDESRPLLTGVLVENNSDGVMFVATDGYRLSLKKIPGEKMLKGAIIIPSRALLEVLKISSEEKQESVIQLSETADGQLSFATKDTVITTRRIEGEYPNYQKIIPSSFLTQVRVDTQELYQAVKAATIFARDSAGIIKFTIDTQGMRVSANTAQVGENTIEVEAKVEGEGGSLALNSRFLLDMLSCFPSKELMLQITGALSPAVFVVPEDDSYLHIIMPVRVQG